MKICILSVHKVKNYGSALLCYAMQEIFKQVGFEQVEFIDIKRGRMEEADNLREFYYGLVDDTKHNLKLSKVTKFIFFVVKAPAIKKRAKVFNCFLKKYITCTSFYKDEKELYLTPPIAEIYCTGGDQMWNEMYNGHKTFRIVYLSFAPEGKPKVSFSTSFGKTVLEPWEVPEVRKLLQKYSYITVREKSGMEILKRMGITNAETILDPTLILDAGVWRKFAKRNIRYKDYVLVYRVSRESRVFNVAKRIAKYAGKQLIFVSYNLEDKFKGGHSIFVPSPEEFVGLIDGAEYIVTDSFHGTAFSINLNKRFVAVLPSNTSTRIENIVRQCQLDERIWNEKCDIKNYLKDIEYKSANIILQKERKKAMTAADNIFNIAKESMEKGRQ